MAGVALGNKSVGLGNKSVVHISLFLFSLSSNFGTNTISALSSQFLGNFLGWCCFRQQVWILRGRVGPDEENPDNYERVREKNVIIFQIYLMPAVEWFGQSCQKKLTNECDQMAQKCPTFELMIFKKEQKTSQNWTNILMREQLIRLNYMIRTLPEVHRLKLKQSWSQNTKLKIMKKKI